MTESRNLEEICAELAAQEPIFHRPAFARTNEDFARLMAPGYWEIGASGKKYDRTFVLQHLAENPPVDADVAGWKVLEARCTPLGGGTFLLTYVLVQNERVTRRCTVWRWHEENRWEIVYHQGTLVSAASLMGG